MSWNGVKKQSIKADIEAWCEEMGIENYTINSKGEIDVDGDVAFEYVIHQTSLEELPYKFGIVNGFFSVYGCKKLKSLKNCPNEVTHNFNCNFCKNIKSLEGCPKEVGGSFFCFSCKREFTEEEVRSLCKVKRNVFII